MSSAAVFERARGGKLQLKGGVEPLIQKKEPKKKHKSDKHKAAAAAAAVADAGGAPAADAAGIGGDVGGKSNKSYEELFPAEAKRMAEAKGRTSAWGSNFRAAPEVLHGYSRALGPGERSAEQRLDMRAATKADKFCR